MARTVNQHNRSTTEVQKTTARRKAAGQAARRKVPPLPVGLGAAGQTTWTHVWTTCPWLGAPHTQIVERLAELNDERAELRAELATTGRTVEGSKGQPVQSPLLEALRSIEVSINRTERQLGIAVTAHRAATMADEARLETIETDVTAILEAMQ
jgi:terminase small subunit-like protein